MQHSSLLILSFLGTYVLCWPYDDNLVDWNLNQNHTAEGPIDYSGAWPDDHQYHPSPDNWRFPIYTIFLDRISNGDPTNDDINGTEFEHVVNSNQMRHGGDLDGLLDTLDYIHGMGFKVCGFHFDPILKLMETSRLFTSPGHIWKIYLGHTMATHRLIPLFSISTMAHWRTGDRSSPRFMTEICIFWSTTLLQRK
jgi:hypothetical protein